MADNKKYYYMRLKENFFDTNEMKILEAMQDGYKYSNILLKLYLMSLRDNGRLMLNNHIPYNSQMIATITRHSIGDIEKALQILRELGLIEILDTGAIYMLDIQNFIGKSSSEADRQRKYANRIECEKSCKKIDKKSTPEIELEKDIKTDIDINNNIPSSKPKKVKHKYGEYQNVLLTDEEYNKLHQDYPNANELITYLDEYIEMKGYKAKSHKLAIRKWVVYAVARDNKKKSQQQVTSNPFLEILMEEKDQQWRTGGI